ncbi:MAG: ferritin [Spirochaetes bacterium]|nr:ferritin [Spirochaetota bacterium]
MLSKKVADSVNEQINKEMFSAYLYLAMSAKATDMGYAGIANWLMVQYHEEMFHAMKFYGHLVAIGAQVDLKPIAKPLTAETTIKAIFERVLEHEKGVTASIHALMDLSIAEKDYATQNLLRWYVDEQVEEEKNAVEILTNLKLLGDGLQGLFMLNIELGKRKASVPLDFTAVAAG